MKTAEQLAMELSGEMDEIREATVKSFNVKLGMNQAMHVEALARKMGSTRTAAVRELLEIGITSMYKALDEETKAEMNELCLAVAQDLGKELGGDKEGDK